MSSRKVLVVDDSAIVRKQLAATLGTAGYEILEAADGMEGVRLVRSTPDLALVICDVNMPRMDGIQMVTRLRVDGALPVPVVMLTTEADMELVQEARKLGVKGWLVKPLNAHSLENVVRRLIEANDPDRSRASGG